MADAINPVTTSNCKLSERFSEDICQNLPKYPNTDGKKPANSNNPQSLLKHDKPLKFTELSCESSLIEQIIALSNSGSAESTNKTVSICIQENSKEVSNEAKRGIPLNKKRNEGINNQVLLMPDELSDDTIKEQVVGKDSLDGQPLKEVSFKNILSVEFIDNETENSHQGEIENLFDKKIEKINVEHNATSLTNSQESSLSSEDALNEVKDTKITFIKNISENLLDNIEDISSECDTQNDEIIMIPFATAPIEVNDDTSLIPQFIAPQAGLSDSQPFLSASALSPVASFKDEKSVAIATEMASAHAPPDMPLQLAPTILINATQPIVSIPNLNTLKHSPNKNKDDIIAESVSSVDDDTSLLGSVKNDDLKSEIDIRMEQETGDTISRKQIKMSVVSDHTNDNCNTDSNQGTTEQNTAVKHINKDNIPVDFDEPDFVWGDYLEETGAQAVPPESFQHVESSIENGFEKGAVVEFGLPDETFWIASIVTPCGQLLGLKYIDKWVEDEEDEDEEDKIEKVDVWCDAFKNNIHPLGWCKQNNKILQPPIEIKQTISDIDELLSKVNGNATTPASYLFENKCGTTPTDIIKEGMIFELQEEMNPNHVWFTKVINNVGGRLLLQYVQEKDTSKKIWVFYLNYRVHPVGWCREQQHGGYRYQAPLDIQQASGNENVNWEEVQSNCYKLAEGLPVPKHIYKDQITVSDHLFRKGHKLEALHPKLKCAICPATVITVINQHFFIVEIDDVTEENTETEQTRLKMCCHRDSPNIFPFRWCVRSGLRLLPPKGWKKPDFDWRDYLMKTNADPAPERAFNLKIADHEFERGMKLEAVDPEQPSDICAATIIRIVEHLMWIHLDTSSKIVYNHVLDVRSDLVFPIGWCESNNYTLKPPKKTGGKKRYSTAFQIEKPMTADEYRSAAYNQMVKGEGSGWCPKIYFNHRCFSGAFLSKCRIAELPKGIGPGPIVLVMKEVLSMLINGAYKSSRVLRELQMEGSPNPNMHQQVLKAKYKGKSYRATVEICKSSDQLEEFCRQVCIKLECCPLLISTHCIEGECPENCSQLTKSKYTVCYGKKGKKKLGRPPGGHTNLELGAKKPVGRGRKPKRGRQPLNRNKRKSEDSEEMINGDNESICGSIGSSGKLDEEVDTIMFKVNDTEESPYKKRKYNKKVLPPSDIKTRGVKLPSYSTAMYERRPRGLKIKDILAPDNDIDKKPRKRKAKINELQLQIPPIKPDALQPSVQTIPMFKGETALRLKSNPLYWSTQDVVDFIKDTDSAQFARILKEQEIDGQALLMLSLPTVQEYLDYKLGPAVKLCHHVERLKLAFYQQFT